MTKYNSQKFLESLLGTQVGQSALPAPTPVTSSFVDYMASKSLGMPSENPVQLGLKSQGSEDHRGVLGKTFGWLSSLGTGVENVFMQGMEGDPLEALRDTTAALTHVVQPVIDLGPLPTPWEDKVSDFTYKYNVLHDADKPASGSLILDKLGVDNKLAKYGGGFIIDVLSDPTTYLGGFGAIAKGGSRAEKVVSEVAEKAPAITLKAEQALLDGKRAAQQAGFAEDVTKIAPVAGAEFGSKVPAYSTPINIGDLPNFGQRMAAAKLPEQVIVKGKINPTAVASSVAKAEQERALVTGPITESLYNDFAKRANDLWATGVTPQKYQQWVSGEYDAIRRASMYAGFTQKEASAVASLIKSHTAVDDIDNLEPFQIIETITPKRAAAILDPAKRAELSSLDWYKVGKAIQRQMGTNGKLDNIANNTMRWWDHNMTTWRGRGFMMPKYRSEFSSGATWAKWRADWIGKIMKEHSPDEINAAYARAQKPLSEIKEDIGLPPKVEDLSKQFRDLVDNILAPIGFTKPGDLTGSLAARAGIEMLDLNKHLKAVGSRFQFKVDKKTGQWLDGVKHVNPASYGTNPAIFLYNLDLAVQRTLAEYNVVDQFATLFGKLPGHAGYDEALHTDVGVHSRIAPELRFEREVGEQFRKLMTDMEKGQWRPGSQSTQMLTTGLRKWKSSVTIYYPAHHIHNLVGDTWLMWAAGHNDPRVFQKSLRILGSERKRYEGAIGSEDLMQLQKMIDGEGFKDGWALTEGRAIISNKFKANISADEYYHEALKRGLLLDASRIEDLQGQTLKVFKEQRKGPSGFGDRVAKPFGGKVHNAASTVSEYREHYVRMAHLVSYVEKHLKSSLGKELAKETSPARRSELMEKLFDDAAQEVRKWHPDGSDMSFFEQQYVRNIIPFYSWMRKAVPLLIETMVQRPAKITMYPRGMSALQGALGINTPEGYANPFPENQLFPDWITAGGIGPIGDPESSNPYARFFGALGKNQITPLGQERGYTVIDPGRRSLPAGMIADMLGMGTKEDAWKGLMDSVTPFFSIPADLARNSTNTGAPIWGPGGEGLGSYLLGVNPATTPIQRLSGLGKESQEGTEPGNQEAWVNFLTALGITGTGKYTKSAQYDARGK